MGRGALLRDSNVREDMQPQIFDALMYTFTQSPHRTKYLWEPETFRHKDVGENTNKSLAYISVCTTGRFHNKLQRSMPTVSVCCMRNQHFSLVSARSR